MNTLVSMRPWKVFRQNVSKNLQQAQNHGFNQKEGTYHTHMLVQGNVLLIDVTYILLLNVFVCLCFSLNLN